MKKIIPPASLVQLVDDEIKELDADQKKDAAEKATREKKKAKKAKFNLNFGLGMAEFIWNWVKKLRQSDFGKKMTRIDDIYFYFGLSPRNAVQKDTYLMFNKKGLYRTYQSRFGSCTLYKSAKELALDVPPPILDEVMKLIQSGDVWKVIEERFLRKLRLDHGVVS